MAKKKRIRTVEYDPGWGWLARCPVTGKDILHNFVWRSRSIARAVVNERRRSQKAVAAKRR